ncbi:MAG: hypothetical protein HUU56_16655 [Bdellovibrionaceae bacterium]|nr:hypothetical protein [Pseudobdellovibrionaceae bacterium]
MSLNASEQNVLPPVAKSFFTFCKKCDIDRYHKVLAHKTATSAKIECEVCHSVKTYSLPKTKAKKTSGTTGVKRVGRAVSENQKKSSHKNEYESLMESPSKGEMLDYNIRSKFAESTKLKHPKFGLGYVKVAHSDKIEVIFSDEVKVLVHNRT